VQSVAAQRSLPGPKVGLPFADRSTFRIAGNDAPPAGPRSDGSRRGVRQMPADAEGGRRRRDGEHWHGGSSPCRFDTSQCSSFLRMAPRTLSSNHQQVRNLRSVNASCSERCGNRQALPPKAKRPGGPHVARRRPIRRTGRPPALLGSRGQRAGRALRRLLAGVETRRGRWDLGGRSQRPVAQLPPVSPCAVKRRALKPWGDQRGVTIA
jgi:hypothetical protein